ncbi:protoporphyrinogen oxidase [Amycolatopsis sp. WAC 01376]|uniref:flavodoxin domain-containing protein n=1 Tax=Amycolatopsis sp. WAC 01376 TaxID=2203195 RepID=UPI000F771B92|nr:flavodoxin domain-containing protein [Amycolatopsis sp. WAC 01376]RSM57194.1 protoporphyrinogen oxidase [Amycolatopsis sp. WAC 01376]
MKILVAVASRHGATRDIADEIGRCLGAELGARAVVEVLFAEDVVSVEDYDVVLLGSAVYMGHWLGGAKTLIEQDEVLRHKDVWLFSSGPVGEPPKPVEEPVDVAGLVTRSGAHGHRVFSGRIDRSRLRFAERAMVSALRVKDGDYRDWTAIRDWAAEIAAQLETTKGSGHVGRG